MASDDHNDAFDNLTVTDSFTDPGGTTHTGSIDGSGDGSTTTGVDAQNTDGTPLVTDITALTAGSYLSFVDDGDGTVTLDAQSPDTNTHVQVENTDGTGLVKNPSALTAGSGVAFTDDGDGSATLAHTASAAATATLSGDGETQEFTLSHGLGATPTAVDVTPTSADGSTDFWVTAKTASDVTIRFANPPASGSNNLTFDIIAHE